MHADPMEPRSAPDSTAASARLAVAGIGGCGCAVLRRLVDEWPSADLLAVHTDGQVLAGTGLPCRLQLGALACGGQSTGGDAALGRRAAAEDEALFREWIQGCRLLFLVLGLGGGTGSGSGPVLARLARDAGVPTLCFATLPFSFEGAARVERAQQGLQALRASADALLVLTNDRLIDPAAPDADLSLPAALAGAGDLMAQWVRVMRFLLEEEGVMNLDLGDLRGLLAGGSGVMAYAEASGPARSERVIEDLFASPLLQGGQTLAAASGVMVGLAGGNDLTLLEVRAVMERITSIAALGARVSMGVTLRDAFAGRMAVTLLAAAPVSSAPAGGPVGAKPSAPETKNTRAARRRPRKAEQTKLSLGTTGRGRFKDVEPSIYDGEDLDTPTFIRRQIRLSS